MKRKKVKFFLKRFIAMTTAIGVLATSSIFQNTMSSAKSSTNLDITFTSPVVSTLTLKKGESYSLNVAVTPSAFKSKIRFSSSKKSVVSVTSKGKLKAKKVGNSTISVTTTTGKKKTITLQVKVVSQLVKAKTISFSKESLQVAVGKSVTTQTTVLPKNASVKQLVYRSADTAIATVNEKGVILGKKVGSTKVSAYGKDGRGAKATCLVHVTQGSVVTATPVPSLDDTKSFVFTNEKTSVNLYIDKAGKDYEGLNLVANAFAEDIALVSKVNQKPKVVSQKSQIGQYAVIAGSIGNNEVIDSLIASGKINVTGIKDKWEVYKIQEIDNPMAGVKKALVVVGSDKRGTMYGIFHLSELLGVSPWVYWGDAQPSKVSKVAIDNGKLATTSTVPSVKYRGIFLNDEAPSLSSWVETNFDGFNEKFYQKVYELLLRLKGNYLWPAMWSNTFSEDGKAAPIANAKLADAYGIVMGTSHHEPMCRAGVEWQNKYKNYGTSNVWDYATNATAINKFWEDGIE